MGTETLLNIKNLESELEKYIKNEEAFIKTRLFKGLCINTEIVNYFSKLGIDLHEKDISYIKIDEPLKYLGNDYYTMDAFTESYYVIIKNLNLNLKITISNFNGFKVNKYWSIYIHNIF